MAEKVAASDFVMAISRHGRSQLMRFSEWQHWHKLEVCRLGIDPQVFQPYHRPPGGPVRLIAVGSLAPVKGHHILVDAVQRLHQRGRNVRLTFAGDGPDRRDLEKHVRQLGLSSQIVFEGWCNQDRVRELYRETDIYVLASFAEGVPVVLMEAMAMEIACVATNITGIPELITNRVHGLLVTPSDEEELATAIAWLVDSPELRASLGQAARKKVLEDFDLTRNIETLSEIFERRVQPGEAVHLRSVGVQAE